MLKLSFAFCSAPYIPFIHSFPVLVSSLSSYTSKLRNPIPPFARTAPCLSFHKARMLPSSWSSQYISSRCGRTSLPLQPQARLRSHLPIAACFTPYSREVTQRAIGGIITQKRSKVRFGRGRIGKMRTERGGDL